MTKEEESLAWMRKRKKLQRQKEAQLALDERRLNFKEELRLREEFYKPSLMVGVYPDKSIVKVKTRGKGESNNKKKSTIKAGVGKKSTANKIKKNVVE